MNINQNNYEIFFIDYFDGNLSAEQSAELFLFLELHPELKEAFDSYSNFSLEAPELHFPDRDSLKRSEITFSNIDQLLIGSLEKDNTIEEEKLLKSLFDSNPGYLKDQALYNATVSVPDLSIVYPDKKSIKKPVPFFASYQNEFRYGIAAVLLLAFIAGMVSVFNRTMEQKSVQVAEEIKKENPGMLSQPESSDTAFSLPQTQNVKLPVEKIKDKSNQLVAGNNAPAVDSSNSNVEKDIETKENLLNTPLLFAETIPSDQIQAGKDSLQVIAQQQKASSPDKDIATNTNEKYLTVWEAIRQTSEKSLKKLISKDESVLAYADESENDKPRLVDVVSKGLEKVSNEKVKLDTDKESKRFSFSAGGLKIERK